MIRRTPLYAAFWAVSLCASPALAQDDQELGLDLSGGLGLDLTEPTVAPEFKPALAIYGVTAPDDPPFLKARADGVNAALGPAAAAGEPFSKVLGVEETRAALGADAASFAQCAAADCLLQLADKLDVDRVILGQLAQAEGETRLTLHGFDRGTQRVETVTAESEEQAMKKQLSAFSGLGGKSQGQKDKEFLQKTNGPLFALVGKLKTALGALSVRSYEPDVEVTLNGKPAGKGSFNKYLAAGEYKLHAESPEVLPFDTQVTIEPQKTVELPLTLVARPKQSTAPPPIAEKKQQGTPLFERPGLYVAIAGAVALGVGAALGASAKGVESRAADQDGDGIYDITRAEMLAARGNATAGSVLMGVGAAALAGGAIWAFITPGTGSTGTVEPIEPETGSGGGFTVGVGGKF